VISYRHHVVSLVAVFLALAVGVALGGGPLSDLGREPAATKASAAGQARDTERIAGFGDEFATAGAATLYADRLADQSVSILSLPGADPDTVTSLGDQVEKAGGRVAATYDARRVLVDASEKSLVDTLGSQLRTQLAKDTISADASTYDRIGQLIGLAVSSAQVPTETALSIRQSLAGAGLLDSPGPAPRAPLVLVVLGKDADEAILSGLLSGLAAQATGVVVAGDAASGVDGALHGLRGEPAADEVTTVDGVDSELGRVTAVLALARSAEQPGGSFGASGSDGAVPLG
jgi:copper transport outer membrane protein MctB